MMKIIQYFDFEAYDLETKRATLIFQKRVLETLFEAQTLIGAAWLKRNPEAPLLYASGVYYEREGAPERWYDIPSIIRRGRDDCEGLAVYLAAELRTRSPNSVGKKRRPCACVVLKHTRKGIWHAVVEDKTTGEFFDPSRKLGM